MTSAIIVAAGRGTRMGPNVDKLFLEVAGHPVVAHTWKRITPFADAAVREFYDRLFEIDPTTRRLFQATDMGEQRRKLLSALALVVDGIDHLEALLPSLEALGRRHARIGVTARHYDAVGDALLHHRPDPEQA